MSLAPESDAASDEEMRDVIRRAFGENPRATYWDVDRRWRSHRGQAVAITEQMRLAHLFPEEERAWRTRPSYSQELADWRGAPGMRWSDRLPAIMAKATLIVGQTFLGLGLLLGGMAGFGGLNGLLFFLLLTVACTAGIGLLPLLLVAWAIGWVVWKVVRVAAGSLVAPRSA